MTEPPASVWLLEDIRLEAAMAERVLGKEFAFEWFTDGAALLEQLSTRRPSVLLLDAELPGISGIEVCRFVRERYDELSLPVLFLTAHESQADVVDVLSSGANDYVRKPYDSSELRARVLTLVRLVRAHAERVRLLASEREARLHAERSNRAKDEFLSIVSHELRTPLNAMLGWARLLADRGSRDSLSESAVHRGLETIERNAVAQAQLIEDLLDMSRITMGIFELEMSSISLVEIIEAAIESVRPAAKAKELTVASSLDQGANAMRGDARRLQQVVWNLLSNAIKFTPRQGMVTVTLRRVQVGVEFCVTDTGQGICADFLPKVFERFEQERAPASRSRAGLGLGLAICRHIVELHGGTIKAHSDGEGKGASFTVRLPLPDAASAPALPVSRPEQPTFEHPPELVGLKVLVVDDEPDTRELLLFILDRCGARAAAVASTDEAIAAFEREPWDVLLSDIGMTDQDGYALIRRVRGRGKGRGGATPAAALTAYARPEERLRALEAGFEMHVAKPVEPAELVAIVAALARLRRGV